MVFFYMILWVCLLMLPLGWFNWTFTGHPILEVPTGFETRPSPVLFRKAAAWLLRRGISACLGHGSEVCPLRMPFLEIAWGRPCQDTPRSLRSVCLTRWSFGMFFFGCLFCFVLSMCNVRGGCCNKFQGALLAWESPGDVC